MKRFVAGSLAALVVGATSVQAAPISFSNPEGQWVNPVGGSFIDFEDGVGVDPDIIGWGHDDAVTPAESEYIFDFVDVLNEPGGLNPTNNVPFVFANFTHNNNGIPDSGITSVDYEFTFDSNGAPANVGTRTFSFTHDERPNNCDDVAEPGCADDIVTIASVLGAVQFVVGGETWELSLLGFSPDGGVSFENTYSAPELESSSTDLYAVVRSLATVPEPGALWTLLLGAVAVFGGRRMINRS